MFNLSEDPSLISSPHSLQANLCRDVGQPADAECYSTELKYHGLLWNPAVKPSPSLLRPSS